MGAAQGERRGSEKPLYTSPACQLRHWPKTMSAYPPAGSTGPLASNLSAGGFKLQGLTCAPDQMFIELRGTKTGWVDRSV